MTPFLIGLLPFLGFGLGWWLGRHTTETQAVENYRRRLRMQQAKGQIAAREQALLDGNSPRIRKAAIRGANKRGHFNQEEGR